MFVMFKIQRGYYENFKSCAMFFNTQNMFFNITYTNNLPTRSSILYMKIGFPASDIFGATSYISPSLISRRNLIYLLKCDLCTGCPTKHDSL